MTDLILFREGFIESKSVQLTKEEFAHLAALRLNQKEAEIQIRDGLGGLYTYLYTPKNKDLVWKHTEILPKSLLRNKIAIAIPKGNRLDFFIQKVTEMGILEITFLVFRHSIRREFNLERAKKIVKEAASQSKQIELPQLEIADASQFLVDHQTSILVFHPNGKEEIQMNELQNKIPLIGPEGGFHEEEEELFQKYELPIRRLKGGILRTETAGVVAAALLQFGT